MHNYKQLNVWQDSIEFISIIYEITNRFPKEEKFGLSSQIQRASISIASNIAEGAGRNSIGEFKQFLGIANGSAFEVETQLIIANKLDYLNEQVFIDLQQKLSSISKRIYSLKKSLK